MGRSGPARGGAEQLLGAEPPLPCLLIGSCRHREPILNGSSRQSVTPVSAFTGRPILSGMAAPESLDALRDACGWFLRAMEAEGISEQVRQRTLNRILIGDPDGIEAFRVVAEPDPDGPFVSEDQQTGARYVTLKAQASVARTVHVSPWCVVDYDAGGEPVGVEILP